MRLFRILGLLVIALIAVITPTSSVLADSERWEYYNTGDTSSAQAWGPNWFAQSFTANDSYTLDYIKLCLRKEGTPGTLTAAIYSTNASGYPIDELTSGTYNSEYLGTGNTWPEIDMVPDLSLSEGSVYSIVVHTTGASAGNDSIWRYDNTSPTYTGGQFFSSTDAGGTWANNSSCDFLFECWGETNLDLVDVRVYSDYIQPDDWLIVFSYKNFWKPYYPDYNPKHYFTQELIVDGDIVASVPLQQWGYRPGSIYIAPNDSALLEWGNTTYYVKLNGTFAENPYATYTLDSTVWKSDNYDDLDDWCLLLAESMNDYYSPDEDFVSFSSASGRLVLSEEAGVYFVLGIPYLSVKLPDMFSVVVVAPNISEGNYSLAYLTGWGNLSTYVGTDIATTLDDVGTSWFDLPTGSASYVMLWVLGIVVFGFMVAIGVPRGHHMAGFLLGLPIIVGLAAFSAVGIIYIGLAVFLLLAAGAFRLWKSA